MVVLSSVMNSTSEFELRANVGAQICATDDRERGSEGRSRGLDISEQIGQRNSKGSGYFLDIDQTYVSFSTLDSAHVGSIQATHIGEILLRDADLLSSDVAENCRCARNPRSSVAFRESGACP